ncbi:hypothetical protein Pfo_009084 [Paulownia fortunei]|nr:hypothetical protein Pfo_009084 [Paulownia fortunei]
MATSLPSSLLVMLPLAARRVKSASKMYLLKPHSFGGTIPPHLHIPFKYPCNSKLKNSKTLYPSPLIAQTP